MEPLSDVFLEEVEELLMNLEALLMELEEEPNSENTLGAVFRVMHTIKGSAAMFGYEGVSKLAHVLENMLVLLRDGKITVSKEIISITLLARDTIEGALESGDDSSQAFIAILEDITKKVEKVTGPISLGQGNAPPSVKGKISYQLQFRPAEDLMAFGARPVHFFHDLKSLGLVQVVCSTEKIPPFEDLDPQKCYAQWDIYLRTTSSTQDILHVFLLLGPGSEVELAPLSTPEDFKGDSHKKLRKEEIEVLFPALLISKDGEKEKKSGTSHPIGKEQFIRIRSSRLDTLIDTVAELVTTQARLVQVLSAKKSPQTPIVEHMEGLIGELRETAMSMRMVPIGSSFSKFKRLVRDLSEELGKEINFSSFGGDTELDKNVVEKLNDPLIHILRNAIDHGIETPQERQRLGKTPQGNILLDVSYMGGSVQILIKDDGKGIHREDVFQEAVARGLCAPDAKLSDEEVFAFLMHPGFSTAKKVTTVSGRGVGMDVVHEQLEALNGQLRIESTPGKGSTVSMSLPFTLAIIEGLLVRVGDERYIFPLATIQACERLWIPQDGRESKARAWIMSFRDGFIPYISLREILLHPSKPPEEGQVVIAQTDFSLTGFLVDEVLGNQQVVVKGLGRAYRSARFAIGATILGDGTVALILDANRLVAIAKKESER